MATIASNFPSIGDSKLINETIEQIQEKYNEFVNYATQKGAYWQERVIIYKNVALEKIVQVWQQLQPKIANIQAYLDDKWQSIKSVDWQGYAVTVKEKTLAGLKWSAGHTSYMLKNLWFYTKMILEVAYTIGTNAPLIMFNTSSYIPFISIGTAVVRGVVNVVHTIASLTFYPFRNLLTGGPKKLVKQFVADWHGIFSRTVRLSTEWFPILGNLLWLYYDFKVLTWTPEEREKYALFGVFLK